MPDPRVTKLAQVLINYSLALTPGEEFELRTTPLARELNLVVYKEAIQAGANVLVVNGLPGESEIFFKYASDAQLDYVSPVWQLVTERFNATLTIGADHNTRELAGVYPDRLRRAQRARADVRKRFYERAARKEVRWCYTVFPTDATAQEAGMSLSDYQDFVYSAGMLDLDDPVGAWKREGERQRELIAWLAGKDQVTLKGSNIDLQLSIKDRTFIDSDGRYNFPDGEIFTAPVEQSVSGWVQFSYPAIYAGQEVTDVELWFEDGKAIREKASKGQELLTSQLDTDAGSRYLGEWGIGTNYGIKRFTKHMLFDEKMGGTIHFAVGNGYPESGSQNSSGIHWDMLCDMTDSEIMVDDELFYKDGRFVV
jgi:aminopeptidase